LTVAPPWDVPAAGRDKTVVILPAMGFGTGHHATTRLCLIALQQVGMAGKSVIDVGTGSGVLAVAAAKLGAARAVGIDNDQDAIDNAAENVALNDAAVDLRAAAIEDLELESDTFDVVTANLTGATLIKVAARLQHLAAPQGVLILSGILQDEASAVKSAFATWEVAAETAENEWVALVLRRAQA
jgi:ribosomal protein L11 methyltransferase